MNPRDIWYVLFGLFTISAFPIGILSTHSCVHLSVWLIVHSIICATYYAFMLYFYSTFSNEHHILQEEYASLHQAKEQVLGQLGCEADEYGNDTLLSPGPKDIAKTKSLKLRSHEWGCLFFIAAYDLTLTWCDTVYSRQRLHTLGELLWFVTHCDFFSWYIRK